MNPYAAPKARLENIAERAGVWRDGRLVRLGRDGALPPRCVLCNRPNAREVARTLYWVSWAWTGIAALFLFGMVIVGAVLRPTLPVFLILPVIVTMGIGGYFVRKPVRVRLGICATHRRIRLALGALSLLALAGMVWGGWKHDELPWAPAALWASTTALLALAATQRFIGIYHIRLTRLTQDHIWLAGIGRKFRDSLPELQ